MALLENTVIAAGPGDVSARMIVREAKIGLSVGEVWRLWTTQEGVTEWLVSHASVQLEIGGDYEFYFLPDEVEGGRGGEGCRILSFLPERMLSFTWNAPPIHPKEREKKHGW